MFINPVDIIPPQTVFRVTKTTPRHLLDTLQTHFGIWHILTIPRQLGEKEAANKNQSNWMFINCLHIIPSQTVSRVTQTTPRHIPDTFQTPYRHLKCGTFWPSRGNWEKMWQFIKMSLTGCLSIARTSFPPRQYPQSLRQPTDTPQTPKNRAHFDQTEATRRKGSS